MKKLLVLLLVTVFVFTLTACGNSGSGRYSADDGKVSDNGGSGILDSDDQGSGGQGSGGSGSGSSGSGGQNSDNNNSENNNSENNNSQNQNSGSQGSGANMPSGNGNVSISKDEALDIAFEQAGVSKENARNIEIELDRERSTPVWEIDFDVQNTEYSYDVNANTGEIVKRERGLDF